MTTTKQSWLKRSLAVLLAVMMVMSMGVANVFAAVESTTKTAMKNGFLWNGKTVISKLSSRKIPGNWYWKGKPFITASAAMSSRSLMKSA